MMAKSPFKRILVAVDLSPCSAQALSVVRALAASVGATVEVVHIIDASAATLTRPGPTAGSEAEARDQLHAFVQSAGGPITESIRERILSGDVCDQIVALAEAENFDLVAMGTHGRTGRSHAMLGSIAASVVRTSSRPVLTVK